MNIETKEGMAEAVAWQRQHLSLIKEGGVWIVPRSGATYTISHKAKMAVMTPGFAPEPDIKRVFNAMGWRVV